MNHIGVLHTFIWLDLGYTVEMMRHEDRVSFIMFRIVKRKNGIPMYQISANDEERLTPHTHTAFHVIEGEMNWEGCMQITCDHEPLHFCLPKKTTNFAKTLPRIHRTAYAMLATPTS